MTSNFLQQQQRFQESYLESCLNLRAYDYKVERVVRETADLFASQELQQRLRQKGRSLRYQNYS